MVMEKYKPKCVMPQNDTEVHKEYREIEKIRRCKL